MSSTHPPQYTPGLTFSYNIYFRKIFLGNEFQIM